MNSNSQVQIDSKYECPICQSVMTCPFSIVDCGHTYCKLCLNSLITVNKAQCALCKCQISSSKANKNIEKEMNSQSISCLCGVSVKLSAWNTHSSSCERLLGRFQSEIKSTVVKEAKPTVNRSTFACPLCSERNLDREGLIKHVKALHKNEDAVCPICLCQPWGDANYLTHLYAHLIKRHKFDYDTTVDYNETEDEVLQRVLKESMKDC